VLEQEPARPSSHNPAVDRDLETICLKCLQKEAARRYRSAEALADDLERFLRGEPIQARRTSAAERLGKWARRRPARAALLLLGAVAVLGVAAALLFWEQRRADQDRQKRDNLDAVRLSGRSGWPGPASSGRGTGWPPNVRRMGAGARRNRALC